MSEQPPAGSSHSAGATLVVTKRIAASAESLFDAWTQPEVLREWWGPRGVKCIAVEIDLQVGGSYRIGNELPDGNILWISGRYETIERPHKLVYTWCVEQNDSPEERVTVQFQPTTGGTEVIVTHERIPDAATRDRHRAGWEGCLDGLEALAERIAM